MFMLIFSNFRESYPKVSRLCSVDVQRELFLVPCNAHEVAIMAFGPDWIKPDRNYTHTSSPHNLRRVGYWAQEEWDSVVGYKICPDKL